MKRIASIVLLSLLPVRCATIVHQTTQEIPVRSNPSGANVTVACGDVHNDPNLTTPTVVTVHRKPDHCSIKLTKTGYQPKEMMLAKEMSGLYLGNILIGGIIGLIVDAANGAMWNRKPVNVDTTLEPEAK